MEYGQPYRTTTVRIVAEDGPFAQYHGQCTTATIADDGTVAVDMGQLCDPRSRWIMCSPTDIEEVK